MEKDKDKVINTKQKDCYCDKENRYPAAEYREYSKATAGNVHLCHQEIVFVVKGSMHVHTQSDPKGRNIREWEFIFVPTGTVLSGRIAGNSAILIVRMNTEYPECQRFMIEKISAPLEDASGNIYPLQANESIRYSVGGILMALRDGLKCKHYMQMEVDRILYLLHAYYPQEELTLFFSSVVSPDAKLSEFVRLKWMEYMTVKGLAHAMNMSEQQFSHRFRKVFGTNPRQWMQRQRSQLIYRDLCKSRKKLKDIAMEHKLTTSSLVRYCHRHFGSSPGAIRENRQTTITISNTFFNS